MFESSTASIVSKIADHNRCQSLDYERWPHQEDHGEARDSLAVSILLETIVG